MDTELLVLKRSFERLDKQYKVAEAKLEDLREKLRETRLELANKDRQLDASRRLLVKLGNERHELAAAAEQSRDLSRKLGAKLSLNPEVPDLQAKLQRSKRKVGDVTAQLHETQTRLLLAEDAARQQAAEVVVLKKALGLRTSLPDLTGYDGQAQLLQALAKSQEESAALAAQLAESGRQATSLEGQVIHLQAEVQRLVALKAAAEEAAAASRRDAAEAAGRASALQLDLDDLTARMRRTNTHLEEVMAARQLAEQSADSMAAENRQLNERLHLTQRDSKAQVESLRSEMQSVVEQSEAAMEQLRAAGAAREAALGEQVAGLQRQRADAEVRLGQASRDHELEALRLQSRLGALEAAHEGARLREAALEREGAGLREELARAGQRQGELTAELAAVRGEAAAHAERAGEHAAHTDAERRLRMQVQSQLEASTHRAAVREDQLAVEAERLRRECAALALANERLQGDYKVCQEHLSDGAARQGANERHIEELHATIQSLTKSKTKLQNTMLEQLSLFKSKLQQVEQENLSLRTALASSSLDRSALATALLERRASPGASPGSAGLSARRGGSSPRPGGAHWLGGSPLLYEDSGLS